MSSVVFFFRFCLSAANTIHPLDIISNYCAAHSVPEGLSASQHVDDIINETTACHSSQLLCLCFSFSVLFRVVVILVSSHVSTSSHFTVFALCASLLFLSFFLLLFLFVNI